MEILDEVFDFITSEIKFINEQLESSKMLCAETSYRHLLGVRDGLERVKKRISQYGAVM